MDFGALSLFFTSKEESLFFTSKEESFPPFQLLMTRRIKQSYQFLETGEKKLTQVKTQPKITWSEIIWCFHSHGGKMFPVIKAIIYRILKRNGFCNLCDDNVQKLLVFVELTGYSNRYTSERKDFRMDRFNGNIVK